MSEFKDKNVVVTGAAGTLGTAVAAVFHDAGRARDGDRHRRIGCALANNNCGTDRPWHRPQRLSRSLVPSTCSPTSAGGFTMGDAVADTSDATWDFMMNLNARTVFNAARAVVPAMKAAGRGKIINISARGGLRGAAAMGAYAASKAVVQRLTETLADELKADGINVNCILPSIIDTPQNRRDMPKARFDHWVPPADIAAVVAFLASNAARSIHGASIPVEGLS